MVLSSDWCMVVGAGSVGVYLNSRSTIFPAKGKKRRTSQRLRANSKSWRLMGWSSSGGSTMYRRV